MACRTRRSAPSCSSARARSSGTCATCSRSSVSPRAGSSEQCCPTAGSPEEPEPSVGKRGLDEAPRDYGPARTPREETQGDLRARQAAGRRMLETTSREPDLSLRRPACSQGQGRAVRDRLSRYHLRQAASNRAARGRPAQGLQGRRAADRQPIQGKGEDPMSSQTEIRPFRVEMPDEAVADLRRRVAATCWPSQELVADASQGVQQAMLQELARYWAADYDWRRCEAELNALPQFKTEIDGVDIHFIHVRSRHENALPLIMTHGWPGSVIEMLGVVGPLTDPTAHGGQAEDAFDLVLPSLPGYGFSGEPAEIGWNPGRVAPAWAELMRRLGYTHYVAQGGDVGAAITDQMGRQAPEGLLGIHLNLLVPALGGAPSVESEA